MDFNLDDRSENQLKWFSHYDQLVINARKRLFEGYVERHHIVPRCMGGTNEQENLVELTAREHYVAHQLLAKIFPEVNGLVLACHMMCVDKNGNRVSNREYEWIRKEYANTISKTLKGQTKETSERCQKISTALTGRTAETHDYLKEIGQKAGNKTRGRKKEDYEYLQRLSILNKGSSKETHEGPKKISEALKGRTKETHESVAKRTEQLKGRTKETHDYLAEMGRKRSLLNANNCEGIKRTAEKRRGKNKYNDPSMKQISETLSVLNKEQKQRLIYLRDIENKKFNEIFKIFNNEGIKISYSALNATYHRFKQEIKNGL